MEKRFPRRSAVIASAALVMLLSSSGCAYLWDRGRDFTDIFGFDAGVGLGLGVDAQVSIYIHAGITAYRMEKATLTAREVDRWEEVGFAPLVGRIILYYNKTEPRSRYDSKEDWPDAIRGGLLASPPIVNELLGTVQYRTTGYEVPARNREAPWINALDVDVGVALIAVSVRFGISPGELIDFLLGWFGFDIGFDDTRTVLRMKRRRELLEAFFAAVEDGDAAVVRRMLRQEPRLCTITEEAANKWKPLHYAAKRNRKDVAKLLIGYKADVDAANWYTMTPLHVAARYGSKDVAELLVYQGANVRARDVLGYTPLHYCGYGYLRKAPSPGHEAVAKFLLARRIDVNARGNDGKTPLGLALEWRHKGVAKILREHGGRE